MEQYFISPILTFAATKIHVSAHETKKKNSLHFILSSFFPLIFSMNVNSFSTGETISNCVILLRKSLPICNTKRATNMPDNAYQWFFFFFLFSNAKLAQRFCFFFFIYLHWMVFYFHFSETIRLSPFWSRFYRITAFKL